MAKKWCTKLAVAWKRCPIVFQRHLSNFKVTQDKKTPILTRIGRFETVTPLQGHLSNFKVTWDKKLPILTRIEHFWTVTPVWFHRWFRNVFFEVIHQIKDYRGRKIEGFNPVCVRLLDWSQLSNPSDLPCFVYCEYWLQIQELVEWLWRLT